MNTLAVNKCLAGIGTGDFSKQLQAAKTGGFTNFVKVIIIVIAIFVIITTVSNIVAYSVILKNPEDEQNISSAWCIAMAVINGLLLVAAVAIIVLIISYP